MTTNNPREKVIGLGAGGHSRVVIDMLIRDRRYELTGLLDPTLELQGKTIMGVQVIGNDELLPTMKGLGVTHFFVGLGGVGDNLQRELLFKMAMGYGLKPVNIIHPRAIISDTVRVGKGVAVMAGSVINAYAQVGENVIINTSSIVEHDCVIGDHAHIATGAHLAGTVRVGTGAHIGIGAVVRQCIDIGERAVVGAGAVVVKNVQPETLVFGVPARQAKEI